jgi:succinate dehydrogenase / fumarate reductase membrane anchor subunit
MAGSSSYRTPLGRARGLGAAHHGVSDFIGERVTGIALAPLCLWAAWAVIAVAPGGYEAAFTFLHNPIQATLAVLLILISAKHMHAGMRVIVEDYVHNPLGKACAILASAGLCLFIGAAGTISILKVAFAAVNPSLGA